MVYLHGLRFIYIYMVGFYIIYVFLTFFKYSLINVISTIRDNMLEGVNEGKLVKPVMKHPPCVHPFLAQLHHHSHVPDHKTTRGMAYNIAAYLIRRECCNEFDDIETL